MIFTPFLATDSITSLSLNSSGIPKKNSFCSKNGFTFSFGSEGDEEADCFVFNYFFLSDLDLDLDFLVFSFLNGLSNPSYSNNYLLNN